MGIQYKWQCLHSHGNHLCPCTCLAVRDKTIVTAGEDGKMVVLSAEQKSPQRIIGTCMSHTVITPDTGARIISTCMSHIVITTDTGAQCWMLFGLLVTAVTVCGSSLLL